MPATARIEAEVWGDVRFRVLARQLGCDWYSAIGRMAALWGECTNRCVYVLDAEIVAMYLECETAAVEAILCRHAKLGEDVPDGIRIRGTVGRIEWLHQAREAGRRGGQKTAATKAWTRGDGGKFVSGITPTEGVTEASPKRDRSVTEASPNPTATATVTATVTATEQQQEIAARSCASKPHADPGPTKEKPLTKPQRDKAAARSLGAAVTRWLNSIQGRNGSNSFGQYTKEALAAGKRWRKAGWDFDLVTKAIQLRAADIADLNGGRYLRPSTLYNGKLEDYVAMVREGMTPKTIHGTGKMSWDEVSATLEKHLNKD